MGGNISCVPARSDKLNASVRALGNINRKASITFGFVSRTGCSNRYPVTISSENEDALIGGQGLQYSKDILLVVFFY